MTYIGTSEHFAELNGWNDELSVFFCSVYKPCISFYIYRLKWRSETTALRNKWIFHFDTISKKHRSDSYVSLSNKCLKFDAFLHNASAQYVIQPRVQCQTFPFLELKHLFIINAEVLCARDHKMWYELKLQVKFY